VLRARRVLVRGVGNAGDACCWLHRFGMWAFGSLRLVRVGLGGLGAIIWKGLVQSGPCRS
jgi:hypothetical protein